MLFSATIEKSVAHLVASYVKNPARISIGATTKPAEHVDLHVYEVDQDRKLDLLTRLLRDEPGAFLVFARTKHGADRLAKHLGRFGHDAARIHGDRTQGQRNQALQGFKDGRFRVLVATDVAARGIHVDNIAHVVNYDHPQVPEDFIHRAGRTGRAGSRGVASTFHTRHERGDIRQIERALQVQLNRRVVPAGEAPVAKYAHVDDVPDIEKIAAPPTKAASTAKKFEREKPRFQSRFAPAAKGNGFRPRTQDQPAPAREGARVRDGFKPRESAASSVAAFRPASGAVARFNKAGSSSRPPVASMTRSGAFPFKSAANGKPANGAKPKTQPMGSKLNDGFRKSSSAGGKFASPFRRKFSGR
jgi:superfamily II DNA/RNA helicase